MKVLLDTNALLWVASGIIDAASAKVIDDPDNEMFYSTASIWEIVIKRGLDRPDFSVDPYRLTASLASLGYRRLNIKEEHILVVGALALIHNDPFDRIIVAQSIYERMTLLTADETLEKYGISILLAKKRKPRR
jgi:PIN domain nuclease of toxin-antitoxin system